jgi:hypothetical protein
MRGRMSVDAEIFGLVGVFVGAVLSSAASYLAANTDWRRGQSVRWDDRRLAAYAEYGYAVKDIVNISARLAAARGLQNEAEPLDASEANLTRLAEAEAHRSANSETFRLLADPATSEAAISMTQCAWNLSWLARGVIKGDQKLWGEKFREYELARDDYMTCARKELGVKGAHVPTHMPRLSSFSDSGEALVPNIAVNGPD